MSSLSVSGSFDINSLFEEAQTRWLKPAEVLFILQNHDKYQLTHEPPQRPTSGSLYLFNKRVLRFFRRDGHNWRKKRDGRTVGEAHERLKVGNAETLNCYYAHGEDNSNFQRRSYWMLDPAFDHIVLVHYREITEGKPSPRSFAQLSPISSSAYSPSTGSVEVNSGFVVEENGVDSKPEYAGSGGNDVSQFFRRLEEQLSLNDDSIREIGPFYGHEEGVNASDVLFQDELQSFGQVTPEGSQSYGEIMGTRQQKNDPLQLQESGDTGSYSQSYTDGYSSANKESLSWNELMMSIEAPSVVEKQGKAPYSFTKEPLQENQHFHWPDGSESGLGSCYDSVMKTPGENSVYCSAIYDQGHLDNPLGLSSNLTVGAQQKFSIREISPEWGYATETTKVIIVGSFLCDPSQSSWTCMFGESEVALEIIQEGVICCVAPPHLPGKVSLCITSSNRVSCSEVREFEYQEKASCKNCTSSRLEVTKRPEELLLLVRCIQMLLTDSAIQQWDTMNTGSDVSRKSKADDDLWSQVIESLLIGGGTTSGTMDWLMEQLVKDKLQEWLSSKERHNEDGCSLTKKEQGIIHMIAGLGFEWALNPILSCGVSINFRDINGWTALHWAARFGREKMVAALLASGASPIAVTDPNPHDPIGRTPASIADNYGHKGLAGYLSEVGLTSHLSSLRLTESELSKGSAEIQAEQTIDCIPRGKLAANDDTVSMKDTLAAVRNAAQAAARIQSAFRAHSFRRRRERVVGSSSADEYGIKDSDIEGLSALSKMTFGLGREHNSAALSIQKKYRGWRGRKDFLALRQKVVKIQAHVRGYQVRKNNRVCWAVGILDKVVLRWRRKGVGLRGFRNDMDCIDDTEEEDILKVFRHQKVDKAIDEAVSRVLSMVDSVEARQQYQRMLLKYRQAKEALGTATNISALSPIAEVSDMENESSYHF